MRHDRSSPCMPLMPLFPPKPLFLKQLPDQTRLFIRPSPDLNCCCEANGSFRVQGLMDLGYGFEDVPHFAFYIRSIRMKLDSQSGLFDDLVGPFDLLSHGNSRANRYHLDFGECFHFVTFLS